MLHKLGSLHLFYKGKKGLKYFSKPYRTFRNGVHPSRASFNKFLHRGRRSLMELRLQKPGYTVEL